MILLMLPAMIPYWRIGNRVGGALSGSEKKLLISIHAPQATVVRGERLTKCQSLMDIAAEFGFLYYGATEQTVGRAGSKLNSFSDAAVASVSLA